jgi:ParB family chromosome partitioning protein
MAVNDKKRLGRGLSSLINSDTGTQMDPQTEDNAAGRERSISIDEITPNPYQPRKEFDQNRLEELAQSIRQEGIIQPLIVTESKGDVATPFTLIAGERRLRAAKLADLKEVPCLVRSADERQLVEWALIENIQRADLNPIERAEAYHDYMSRFKLNQQEVGERMGQPRTTVANYLRLLDLQEEVQKLIADGQISLGHAKVLAGLNEKDETNKQIELARKIVSDGLSVRKLEKLVNKAPKQPRSSGQSVQTKAPYIIDLEEKLTETIGTKVTILPGRNKNSGKVVVEYYSLDDFDRIADSLGLQTVGE